MNQPLQHFDSFYIIGISIETRNKNGQASEDMGTLWGHFLTQQMSDKIPNKINDDIYAIYTDFESDYRGKYTAILGHRVQSLDTIPIGFIGRKFSTNKYQPFTAKGAMPAAVAEAWNKIWEQDQSLNRSYIADFEIYGTKAQNGDQSEVDIYVGMK